MNNKNTKEIELILNKSIVDQKVGLLLLFFGFAERKGSKEWNKNK